MVREYMLGLGYTNQQIDKIINTYPLCTCVEETMFRYIYDVYEFLLKLGYNKNSIIKMTSNFPRIYSYKTSFMNQKIEYLASLRYTQKEILLMIKKRPLILGASVESVKQKIDDIVALGYSKDDVIKMIKILPPILGLSIDNIREKKLFYDSIGLTTLFVVEPRQIMQSVDLSYARYMFYQSIGINIAMDNYRLLFIGQKLFAKRHGKNNKELIEEFNYGEYLEKRLEQEGKRKIMK